MAILAPPISEGRDPFLLPDKGMFPSGFGGMRSAEVSFALISIIFSFS